MPCVELPFGDRHIAADLPDDTFFVPSMGGGAALTPLPDLESAVMAALAEPLESAPLVALLRPDSRLLIAFDDPTVPAFGPIRRVALEAVLRLAADAGVQEENIACVCANALHRKFTPHELGNILGEDMVTLLGDRLRCHDAEDRENLVYLGRCPEGYDVEVARAVVEADVTVYINAASYRGFAGGWKSVCVGLSTYRSIQHHHHPDGMSMSVDDNRMHAVLNAMGRHLESQLPGKIFKIDAVEAGPFATAAVFAGNTWATREAVLALLRNAYPPRRTLSDERFDVILYGVPAWSPYAIFAEMNPILTLLSSGLGYLGGTIQALGKPGCTVIMATPCPDTWDMQHHPAYRDVWDNVLPRLRDPYEIHRQFADAYASHPDYIEKYRRHYAFHPVHAVLATHPLRRLKHCGEVIVAGIESPHVAERLGFAHAPSVETALGMARAIHGPSMRVACAQHPAAPTKLAM